MSSKKPPADDAWKNLRTNLRDRIWSAGAGWKQNERACAEVLCRHAPNIFPSIGTIAAEAGCGDRTARKCLQVLVNGDPGRGIDPVFVRWKRPKRNGKEHAGYQYDFVRDPDALEDGRARHAEQGNAMAAALAGRSHPARVRVGLPPDLEREKERIEERIRKAGKDVALGLITDEAYQAEKLAIEVEAKRLARRAQRKRAKSSGAPTAA